MKILKTTNSIINYLNQFREKNLTVGFVPTMGALHKGHISLIERAKNECDLVVVSIFVNPKQFNNNEDFINYPIKTENDLNLLNDINTDLVFLPSISEIYSDDFVMPKYSIGLLDNILEGEHRPGHFKGVVEVVYRLFQIVNPNKAYFGLKDFQQLAVIKKMTLEMGLPIKIIPCDTLREKDGLAMSSRNLRLNANERQNALFIYKMLIEIQAEYKKYTPKQLKKIISDKFINSKLKLEYIEFIDSETFEILNDEWKNNALTCIAAYSGNIRLIDNMFVLKK